LLQNIKYHFSDFTEKNYELLLKIAKKKFEFESFCTTSRKPHIILRHDVDVSIHRALALAKIETKLGVHSTFFLRLHCEYYNVFEKQVYEKIKKIVALGHQIGLHFDTDFFDPIRNKRSLTQYLKNDKKVLESICSKKIKVFSFHNPEVSNVLRFNDDKIAGMINVYGKKIKSKYTYCSDSNGYWRYQRLEDVLKKPDIMKLHILIHPEWWQKKPLSPQQRIIRSIEGRANNIKSDYITTLKKMGRRNIVR